MFTFSLTWTKTIRLPRHGDNADGEIEMDRDASIFIGAGEVAQNLNLKLANRHGLIAGATSTGKTVSLRILAEGFSAAGVPVFVADVKGD